MCQTNGEDERLMQRDTWRTNTDDAQGVELVGRSQAPKGSSEGREVSERLRGNYDKGNPFRRSGRDPVQDSELRKERQTPPSPKLYVEVTGVINPPVPLLWRALKVLIKPCGGGGVFGGKGIEGWVREGDGKIGKECVSPLSRFVLGGHWADKRSVQNGLNNIDDGFIHPLETTTSRWRKKKC